ncbi:MAG: ABC transporter substrate-binding protein [Actinomycetota bacterium]|nr:ABC transporter substrate-binding protein [Actinomycetota bacterium]
MRLHIAAVVALAGLSACGTTVPTALQATAPTSDGFTVPSTTPTSAPGQLPPGAVAGPGGQAPVVPGGGATTAPLASLPVTSGNAPDHSPLSVGIITTNNDAASGAGVDNGNTFTPRRAYTALVAAWNARGGVAGSKIVPVYFELASSSGNVGTDLERACATFTQDNHVGVVLGTTGFFDEAFTQCLARARVPLVSSDYALGDEQSLRAASTLIAPSTLTTDARTSQLLQRFSGTKRLTSSSRLGVIVEGCAYTRRTYDRTVVPLAKQLGLTIAGHEETRCFHGLPDLGGQAAELQGVVLRFQSSRVSDVLFVSGGMEGNLMLLFGAAAESQQYHPHYALTSGVSAVVQEGNTPGPQLQNAAGLGWLPDVDSDRTKVTRPEQVQCLGDLRRGGMSPTSPVDRTYGYDACDSLSLLAAALRVTSGSPAGLVGAVSSLGRSFTAATTYGGTTDFSAGRRTGPSTGRVFAWQSGCGCFDYTGPTFTLIP